MPTTEELLEQLENNPEMYASEESQELVIDADSRTINIPASETLFGVKGDKNIERKYFRCPKIVGDNIDLSTHLIYIAYVYTEKNTGSIFPTVGIQPYYCDDVSVDGDDITFSWKLSENVFQSAGFIVFKMYAKEKEDSPYTVFNTAPAVGTVLYTIGDGVESIVSEYPDIINQIFKKLEEIEQGGGESGTPGKDGREIEIQNNGTAIQWRYSGESQWNDLVQISEITGPQGPEGKQGPPGQDGAKGEPGENGITPTIGENGNWYLGETDTGKPSRGERGDPGQKGDPGEKGDPGQIGATPDIQIGTVQTLDPEQQATASISGSPENPVLNLGIPKGEKGGEGGITPSDYEAVKQNAQEVWVKQTLTYSIANNRDSIFEAVENSKADKLTITDGSNYWDADEETLYPSVLSMKYLRECRFYREMWLPNGLDITQSYRYAVDKNGHIRIYNLHDQITGSITLSPWGIALKAEGQTFPTTACHFICSTFRILGLNETTGKWELIKNARPIGSLYTVAVTTGDDTVIGLNRTELGNGMYSFAVNTPSNWTADGDMCFHFFCQQEDVIKNDDVQGYNKIMVVYRLKVQEKENSGKFTCSSGCDVLSSISSETTEGFFGRFNAVTTELKEFISHNVLEPESSVFVDNMVYLNELLSDAESYTIPVMSETTLGGGKAIAKTNESVPVAIDINGQLFVPSQSEESSGETSSPYDGKTVVMFGDSIVAGWGWNEGYGITKPLQEKYPSGKFLNLAVSGKNMANTTGSDSESIISKVKSYSGAADGILLEGGTNDNSSSVPIGTITSGYDDSFDETTFTGALESALRTIMNNYPLACKMFLIPHNFAKNNSYVDDYHNRAIEVCEKWNMPVLDMRKKLQIAMTTQNKERYTRNPNTNRGDGVHPTEALYRAFYSPIIDQYFRQLGILDDMGTESVEPPENVPVTGVTLDQSNIVLTSAGQTQQLLATVYPINATNKSVAWESDHPEYATVTQDGVVQAVESGTSIITVRTKDGNKTDKCTVDVQISPEPEEHEELSKIEIDKDCWFDTEFIPDNNTKIEIKVRVKNPSQNGTWVFGVRNETNKYTISITDNWYCTRGPISSAAGNTPYWDVISGWTISNDGNVFDFNGSKVSVTDVRSLDFSQSAYIGNCNNNGLPYAGQGFDGELYYCKMYSGEILAVDIVPVKKSDGTLCLYDRIRKRYIYNLGTGNLT